MPTYEYKCTKCGTEFEVVKKMTAKPGSKCPKCDGKAERQMSAGAGLVFKGSGFYLTDYGRAGQKTAEAERSGGETAAKPDKTDKAAKPDKPEKAAKPDAPAPKPTKKKDD
jgi:putative FmdB family regulatory protein